MISIDDDLLLVHILEDKQIPELVYVRLRGLQDEIMFFIILLPTFEARSKATRNLQMVSNWVAESDVREDLLSDHVAKVLGNFVP